MNNFGLILVDEFIVSFDGVWGCEVVQMFVDEVWIYQKVGVMVIYDECVFDLCDWVVIMVDG